MQLLLEMYVADNVLLQPHICTEPVANRLDYMSEYKARVRKL